MTNKRGRPTKEQTEAKRERPVHHQDERSQRFQTLMDMQQAAQNRISDGGKRISLKSARNLDWADQDPNFHYYWGSDAERSAVSLQQLFDSGYTMVTHDYGAQKGNPVVKHSKGCTLYLMRQPMEYFQLDQDELNKRNNERMQEIKGVGAREYAGDSKELGKGKVAKFEYTENPDAISILDGEQQNVTCHAVGYLVADI